MSQKVRAQVREKNQIRKNQEVIIRRIQTAQKNLKVQRIRVIPEVLIIHPIMEKKYQQEYPVM